MTQFRNSRKTQHLYHRTLSQSRRARKAHRTLQQMIASGEIVVARKVAPPNETT